MTNLQILPVILIALLGTRATHAIEVFLTGPAAVDAGAPFEIGFWIDLAGDPILGGGVDVFYDASLVSFSDFAFNPALACNPGAGGVCGANELDPAFSFGPTDDGLGMLSLLTFGNFNGLDFNTPLLLGTLTFEALAAGLADFSLDTDTIAGWASDVPPFPGIDPATIDASGWSTEIRAAVREPAIVLLLAGGGLVMLRVRRKTR